MDLRKEREGFRSKRGPNEGRKKNGASSSNLDHGPGATLDRAFDHPSAQRLAQNGFFQNGLKLPIAAALAEEFSNIDFLFGKEARPQFTICGKSQTITGIAKMVADRANKTDFPLCLGESEKTSWSIVGIFGLFSGDKGNSGFNPLPDFIAGDPRFFFPLPESAEWHEFDEADLKWMIHG